MDRSGGEKIILNIGESPRDIIKSNNFNKQKIISNS